MQTIDPSSVDLSAVVDGLDLEDELFGSLDSDDGVNVSIASKGATIDDDEDDTTTGTAGVPATTGAIEGTLIPANGGGSKMDRARVIFNRMYGKSQRKDIIQAFITEADCTKAGAGTYYQTLSTKRKAADALAQPVDGADVTTDTDGAATLEA